MVIMVLRLMLYTSEIPCPTPLGIGWLVCSMTVLGRTLTPCRVVMERRAGPAPNLLDGLRQGSKEIRRKNDWLWFTLRCIRCVVLRNGSDLTLFIALLTLATMILMLGAVTV